MIVLDSDVLIDALGGIEPSASFVRDRLPSGILATTAVSRFELRAGTRNATERERVEDLLGPMPILPFDRDAAGCAAAVAVELRRAGRLIPMADLAIAGTCLALGGAVATRNRSHFGRVPGLQVVDPNPSD